MRVLWVLLMLLGVVVFGSLSVLMFYGFYLDREALIAEGRVRGLVWPLGLLLIAGACGAGVFMKPREFREAMKLEPEESPPPPAWLQEMQDKANSQRDD